MTQRSGPPTPRRWRAWLAWPSRWWVVSAALLLAVAGVALCEWRGWPFLERPAERWLGERLARTVDFEDGTGGRRFRLRLFGTVRFEASRLLIGNPGWSRRQPMMLASDTRLELRWRDLLALRRGEPLRIESLSADRLQLQIERLADGRSSWQFGPRSADRDDARARGGFEGLRFGRLAVRDGRVQLNDQPLQLDLDGTLSLEEGSNAAAGPGPGRATGMVGRAEGRFRGEPLTATLRTGPALAGLTVDAAAAVPMRLKLQAGRARLHFDGQVSDLFGSRQFQGRYELAGPSLAAVGRPLGLTLPVTHAFSMLGRIQRRGTHWTTEVEQALVGRSRLAGEFSFDAPPGQVPRLSGRLRGAQLWLEDLGPAVGLPAEGPPAARARAARDRVLPRRPFDLPALRAMNADVSVALDRLEPGGNKLEPMAPLRARLLLDGGVLRINDILARWARGQVQGRIQVDGRNPVARWEAHLAGNGLVIEQWLRLQRPPGRPPYLTGVLGARVDISGQGRSTAEFLASADGRALLHWTRGSISHLVVEGAGIDIAQALGVMLRGDRPLQVQCGAADLVLRDGVVTPKVLLVDTTDSTLWAEGSLSLATERLALVARVEPKDFSPLALRTPLRVDGTLGQPKVSLEKGPLVRRIVPSALLAMLHPLAGLLPLMDAGDDDAQAALAGCRAVAERQGRGGPPRRG